MAIKMVREPSDTPNINNIDDIVPMRYAYGGQNGFVVGKGTEISNTVSGLNFTINSGRLVLQGVECDIDATGVTITIDNIATKRYYTVYLEVNLGLNTATIKSKYDTATYPTIDAGDDLTENTTGIARLPLYQFTATSGVIGEVNKVVESIGYPLSDYNISKGTIESRLTNLGFRQGSITLNKEYAATLPAGTPKINSYVLQRQGNYVIGRLAYTVTGGMLTMNPSGVIALLPEDFYPLEDYTPDTITAYSQYTSSGFQTITQTNNILFRSNGEIYLKAATQSYIPFSFGYEAKPLE